MRKPTDTEIERLAQRLFLAWKTAERDDPYQLLSVNQHGGSLDIKGARALSRALLRQYDKIVTGLPGLK